MSASSMVRSVAHGLPWLALALVACQSEKANTTSTTSSGGPASVSVGAGGGDGGAGGASSSQAGASSAGGGGQNAGGSGATTTTTTTTAAGTGGGIPDECGEPGDCAGDQPSACDQDACEAPEIYFECADKLNPPTYLACYYTERLFRTGAWAVFLDCLRDAPMASQCADGDTIVASCLTALDGVLCPNGDADDQCDAIFAVCQAEGQAFSVDACKADLQAFGAVGLETYAECMDDADVAGACNGTHEACYAEVFPF